MSKKIKISLEVIAIFVITCVILATSVFNPWAASPMTDVQNEILDIAHSVREGFLAYVELDGHYGPVVYEFYGLGYLLTEGHLVHFIMEFAMMFMTVMFNYKTAKLYTSRLFAMVSSAFLTILGWGAITHAGAEEIMFFILSLTCYHVAHQLKSGYVSYHSYLLAVDMGLVFFLQPGYVFIWVALIIMFAIKFKCDGIDSKAYKNYYLSLLEGLITVFIPMSLYLIYFKNAAAFIKQVVIYNFSIMGSFGEGIGIVINQPWFILAIILMIIIILKSYKRDNNITDLICWCGFIMVTLVVIALQGENLPSYAQLSKAVYIVPMANVFSFLDSYLGFNVENYSNN